MILQDVDFLVMSQHEKIAVVAHNINDLRIGLQSHRTILTINFFVDSLVRLQKETP